MYSTNLGHASPAKKSTSLFRKISHDYCSAPGASRRALNQLMRPTGARQKERRALERERAWTPTNVTYRDRFQQRFTGTENLMVGDRWCDEERRHATVCKRTGRRSKTKDVGAYPLPRALFVANSLIEKKQAQNNKWYRHFIKHAILRKWGMTIYLPRRFTSNAQTKHKARRTMFLYLLNARGPTCSKESRSKLAFLDTLSVIST